MLSEMLPLRQMIFPDVDCEIDGDEMWIRSYVRKQHTDGKYYLTMVTRSIFLTDNDRIYKNRIIHQMVREFNFMVYMFLMYSPIDPQRRDNRGNPIFLEDPDQTSDLERVYRVYDITK